MRKITVIFFISLFLFSTTELAELLRIPVLISHFKEHKEHDPDISFIGFLDLHYNNQLPDHHHDKESDTHNKLPFSGSHGVSIVFVSSCPFFIQPQNTIEVNTKLKSTFSNDQYLENNHLSSIWQPPKTC
jgi:hypothetical protein